MKATTAQRAVATSDEKGGETSALGARLRSIAAESDGKVGPITTKELEALGVVLNWQILVEPFVPKYRGVLAQAPQVENAQRILTKVGRVVQMGTFAYQSKTNAGLELAKEPNRPKVGDYVLFAQWAGHEVHTRAGHLLRILDDTDVEMVIRDPELLRYYI